MNIRDLQACVSSITVQAQNKNWASDSKEAGRSGETVITWTLVPPPEPRVHGEESRVGPWTPEEAQTVTLLARKELQRLLLADSMARQAPQPDVGVEALPGYDEAMKTLKASVNGSSTDEPSE